METCATSPPVPRPFVITALCAAVAAIIIGCSSARQVPADVKRIVKSGDSALAVGAYNDALIHFNSALEQHPNLVSARIARGDCYLALADRADAPDRMEEHLTKASHDYAHAIEHGVGSDRVVAYLRAGQTFERLGQAERALDAYQLLRANDESQLDQLVEANLRSGNLLLDRLHESYQVDEPIPVKGDSAARTLTRRAMFYFEETLQYDPNNFRALLGKGVALIHERSPLAAAGVLTRARDVSLARLELSGEPGATLDRTDNRRNALLSTYLLAIAREYDIGINEESNRMYLAALRLDEERNFTPLYLHLYERLSGQNDYEPDERNEITRRLGLYEGHDKRVWNDAVDFVASQTSPQTGEILLGAIAHARLGDAITAYEEFESWWDARPNSDPTNVGPAIERIFRLTNGGREKPFGTLALSRAKAYRVAYPEGDYPKRKEVWDQLRAAIEELSTAKGDPEKDQCVELCAYLTEEILASLDLESQNKESLLLEAKSLTELESNLILNRAEPEFRLGKIQVALNPDADLLGYAERAIERDPNRSFDDAYSVVHSNYQRLVGHSEISENEIVLRNRLEDHLVEYKGTDSTIVATRSDILAERQRARVQAEKAKERREREAAAAEHAKRFRPCVECFVDVKKTEKSCPHCGASLPDGGDDDDSR